MDPNDAIANTKTYISTEFFFYMLPYYLAIVSFAYRYSQIMQHPPKRKVEELPGQLLVTCFEDTYDQDYYDQEDHGITPASYCVKSKLSQFNSYLFLVMCFVGLLGDPALYYAAQHRTYSLLYFLGFVAWQMSVFVLRREYQREIGQSLWTHRFFWIFCGTLSISKMFEDYLQPLNLVLNSLQLFVNVLLAIYGLYRSEDKGDAFLQIDTETPGFAKLIFVFIEFDPRIRRLLKIRDQPVKTITIEGQCDLSSQMQQIQVAIPGNAAREQIQLLNKLPKRNIFVNKKIKVKMIHESIKYFFPIITQMNVDRFETERKYSEFQELDYSLSIHFSSQNFPKLNLPRLNRTQFNRLGQNDHARRAQILEEWLQALLLNPIFVKEQVLDFLAVDPLNSAPFITYYNASYRNFCSKAFLYSTIRQKSQYDNRQNRVSVLKVVEELIDKGKSFLTHIKSLEFEVTPEAEGLKTGSYNYEIVCKIPGKLPLKWYIKKQQQQFSSLNSKIEEELRKQVPFYYQCLMKIPSGMVTDPRSLLKKLEMYGEYIKRLLGAPEYYSFALFKFINFDPLKGEVIGQNRQMISYENIEALDYKNIHKSFPGTGLSPEVIAVQVEENQLSREVAYKFVIMCDKKRLHKCNKDLQTLRNHLVKFYKNLAPVPDLPDYSRKILPEELDKIKSKTEEFLTNIFNLPQIAQNPTFGRFISPDLTLQSPAGQQVYNNQ